MIAAKNIGAVPVAFAVWNGAPATATERSQSPSGRISGSSRNGLREAGDEIRDAASL